MGVFLPEIELPLDYRDRDFFGGVFEENLLLRHKKKHRAPVKAFSVAFSASMRLARLAHYLGLRFNKPASIIAALGAAARTRCK